MEGDDMKRWLWIGGWLLVLALFVLPGLGIPAGQVLGFLVLLLCPLLHFFIGHGRHGHGHGGTQAAEPPVPGPQALRDTDGEETAGTAR
jgi:hypothetical protein